MADQGLKEYQPAGKSDIQDKTMENRLSDRGSMLAAMIERANDGIAVIQDTLLVYVNSRLGEILGYEVDRLLNSPFTNYIHPDELERVAEFYSRRMAGEDAPPIYETAILHSDGRRVEVEVNAGIIEYGGQQADFVFIRDISERKRVDAALRHSEEEFRSLVQNLSDMVFVVDEESRIRFETPSVSRVLGYPPGHMVGKIGFDFIHPDDKSMFQTALLEVIRREYTDKPTEFRMQAASGDWVPVEAIGSNRLDVPGVEGIVITAREIIARKKAEEDLRRLMAFNEQIVQGVAEGIILQRADGIMTFSNPAASSILGYEPGELEGMHWTDLVPKDQYAKVRAALQRREQGASDRYELQMKRKDGRRITVWVSGSPRYQQGEYAGIMAVFRDITERKETELRVQRLLEQQIAVNRLALNLGNLTELEAICKTTGDMVNALMVADAFIVSLYDLQENKVSSGYARAYGEVFDNEMLPDFSLGDEGHYLHRTVLESGSPLCVNDYNKMVSDHPAPEHMKLQLSEGHRHFLQLVEIYTQAVLAVPMKVGGETIGVMMVHSRLKDVYQDQHSNLLSALANMAAIAIQNANLLEHARQSAQRTEQILQTVPEGMLLLDSERRVLMANQSAERYLEDLADFTSDAQLDRLGDTTLDSVLAKQQPVGLRQEVKSGKQVYAVEARPMMIGPSQGGWVIVIRDVTREQEIERWIQQQDRLATVGQLAAGIAHDFNNIMSTIVLYSQMSAQSPWVSSRDRERMATIYQQAMHATDLIRQILDFSRRSVLERQPLSLRPLVKEQIRLFERTLAENIMIEVEGMTKRCAVYADPTRLQQVMMNLALNARDAMPDGGTLRIGLDLIELTPGELPPIPEMTPGYWVRLTMADSGVGIDPESIAHIFEPFYTTKGRGEGTGLGLAQVYGIVSQHNGYIDVKSEPEKGSVFSIYLPALAEDLSNLPDLDTGPLKKGRAETILVVEDSPFTRQALVDSLESLNYRTLTAANGREALDILLENTGEIDLVLSDVIMPEMSGVALVREIVEHKLDVRTVLLTGHFPGKEMEALRNQGMVELIEKPPSLEKLSEVVGEMLKH